MTGLTEYGKRIIELNRLPRERVVEIYVNFFGENPMKKTPKYRLAQLIAWREAVDRGDGNLNLWEGNLFN